MCKSCPVHKRLYHCPLLDPCHAARHARPHNTGEKRAKASITSQPVQYRDSVSLRNGSGTHRPRQAGCKSQNQTKQRQKRGQMNKTHPPSSTSPCFYKLAENCRNKDCIDKPASQTGGLLQRPDAEHVFFGLLSAV